MLKWHVYGNRMRVPIILTTKLRNDFQIRHLACQETVRILWTLIGYACHRVTRDCER